MSNAQRSWPTPVPSRCSGLTLVEVLLVVAIIGIMATLVISSISGASQSSAEVIARQQQAALQSALQTWIVRTSATSSIAAVRSTYSASGTKLALIGSYLDADTLAHFGASSTNATQVRSEALNKIGKYLTFSTWSSTNYPRVEMQP